MIFIWIIKALAYVIVFILFILLVILLAPIRYNFNADYNDKLNMRIKASWILRAFIFVYDTDLKPAATIKIFGRTGQKKHKEKNSVSSPDGISDSDADHYNRKKKKVNRNKTKNKDKANSRSTDDNEEQSGKKDSKGLWDKFINYPYKDALVKKSLLLIKRLIKALLPGQAYGECRFGFDDPSVTGLLLGASHTLLGMVNLYNCIDISGDFDKKYLSLKCGIAGKITLWSLLWPLIAYMLSRPVRVIIKPVIFKNKMKG